MHIQKRQGAYLPHWSSDGRIYDVCFRLVDSLPASVLEKWKFEREDIVITAAQMQRELTEEEQNRLDYLYSE